MLRFWKTQLCDVQTVNSNNLFKIWFLTIRIWLDFFNRQLQIL